MFKSCFYILRTRVPRISLIKYAACNVKKSINWKNDKKDRGDCYINFKRQIARSRYNMRDVDIIREILGGFLWILRHPVVFLEGPVVANFLSRRQKKRRKQISKDRERGRGGREGRGGERRREREGL